MTENLKTGVLVHRTNPPGVVAQGSGFATNPLAAPIGGNGRQVFFVRFNDRENMLLGGVKASGSGYGPFSGKDGVCVCR